MNIISIINYLQSIPPELVSLLTLVFCYFAIFIFYKYWQVSGVYVFICIAIISCNIHVMKAAEFTWYSEPIALGTILYATTFLASDLLTELHGREVAQKAIFLSFTSSIVFIILMTLALGYSPLGNNLTEHQHFNNAHNALMVIFTPSFAIITASFTAYMLSQLTDIFIFSKLKKLTTNKHLWLRTIVAVGAAALIDSFVFNILAWKVFALNEVSWSSLLLTYILGAYILQMLVASLNVPALYTIIKFIPKNQ